MPRESALRKAPATLIRGGTALIANVRPRHLGGSRCLVMPGSKRGAVAEDKAVSPPATKRAKTRVESGTTNKAVKSFFTPASKKEPERITWRIIDKSLLVGRYDPTLEKDRSSKRGEPAAKRCKVAAFDFDCTLIATSSGNVFGKSPSDWKWWNPVVPSRLRELHAQGYQLVVISNQGGLDLASKENSAAKTKRVDDFKTKVGYVFSQLDLPISLYAASGQTVYRKPRPGMWREVLDDHNLDVSEELGGVDMEGSFFVGDAAGRVARGKIKADFSSSDRGFADNVGLNFLTPERFFLGDETEVEWKRAFDPLEYIAEMVQAQVAIPESAKEEDEAAPVFTKRHDVEIVIFVGSPGSGKSTFYRTHMEPLGYVRANQDALKTRDKCIKVTRAAVGEGKEPVAVDNTNADKKTRAVWVSLAKSLNVPIRCVWLQAPPELCRHNDAIRSLNDGQIWNPEQRFMLPGMAFEGYKRRFEEPQEEEGFEEVIRVPFKFHGSDEMKKVWASHWT